MLKSYIEEIDFYIDKYKKLIVWCLIIISINIVLYFYYFNTETISNTKIDKTVNNNQRNIETRMDIIIENKIKKENINKEKSKEEIESFHTRNKKEKILYSTSSSNSKYQLQLIVNEEIISYQDITKFISIIGIINDNKEDSSFALSVDENYIYNLENISLKIKDLENNEFAVCNGNFLSNLSTEFNYSMNIFFSGVSADCNIVSQSYYSIKESKSFENIISKGENKINSLENGSINLEELIK